MNVGDIVRVVRQPSNHIVRLMGEVGYVNEKGPNGMVDIVTMHEDGSMAGTGWVPEDCLQPETDEKWRVAKAKIDANRDRIRAEGLARGQRYQMKLKTVADKHGISVEAVTSIWEELQRAEDQDWR